MQEFDYIVLLNKRFTGEINSRESALLDAWIGESPEHAQLAEQYQIAWNQSKETDKVFDLDLVEFRRLQSRIRAAERPPARVVPIGARLLQLAAAVALLLAAIWGYRQFVDPDPAMLVVVAENQEKHRVELADGTRLWLRQNARLEYPSEFDAKERRVKLSGEAYFEVAPRAGQPFRVELDQGGLVEVLGTRFQVNTTGAASVLVREGKVRFSPDGRSEGVVLNGGDKAVFNRQPPQLRLTKVATFNELAWQTGGLEFVRTPLREVVADLEKYYQVKIELRNPALQSCLHNSPLTNQPLDSVLEGLSVAYKLQLSRPAPGRYVLSKGVCQ